MPDSIYARPADYDLEHEGDAEDARFYGGLVTRLRPRRVLELGCGSGRVLVRLAAQTVRDSFELVGVDASPDMLGEAARKLEGMAPETQRAVRVVQADIREFVSPDPFDLIIVPCSTLCHVQDLDDQLRVWRHAHGNLVGRPLRGGRFDAQPARVRRVDADATPSARRDGHRQRDAGQEHAAAPVQDDLLRGTSPALRAFPLRPVRCARGQRSICQ